MRRHVLPKRNATPLPVSICLLQLFVHFDSIKWFVMVCYCPHHPITASFFDSAAIAAAAACRAQQHSLRRQRRRGRSNARTTNTRGPSRRSKKAD